MNSNSSPTDEDISNPSPTPDYVISKPWKESKIARSWMINQESDPFFDVSRHAFPFSSIL
jgi:hypothetical protein